MAGTMNHFFRMMSDHIRDRCPESHATELYSRFRTTPYGVPISILSSPIQFNGERAKPKWAPRPFGFDKGARWLSEEELDERDVVEVGEGEYEWVGGRSLKGKL